MAADPSLSHSTPAAGASSRTRVGSPAVAPWAMYVLRCADGSLYTGITTDTARRAAEHNGERAGGARYTRARRPVEVVHTEAHPDRASAAKAEAAFKRLSRAAKQRRVDGD